MFFVVQGWKWCQNWVAACAITTVKTMCFEWFHVCDLFSNLVSGGKVLDVILESVGSLGDIFSHLLGSWRKVWNLMIFQSPPGRPKAKDTRKVRVKSPSWGPKHHQNQDYQSSCLEILRILVQMTDDCTNRNDKLTGRLQRASSAWLPLTSRGRRMWNMYGICMEHVGNICGICTE